MSWLVVYVSIGWLIRIGMVPIILRRELAPGASVAWLGIVFLHPYIGSGLYLLIGETRLGPRRVERHRALVSKYRAAFRTGNAHIGADSTEPPGSEDRVAESGTAPARGNSGMAVEYEPMVRQAQTISGLPVLAGNDVEFIGDTDRMIDRLVDDIAAARSHVHLLYYIVACDAVAFRVSDALLAAARRGIACRLLVDGVGSRAYLGRRGMARRLRAGGVKVAAALPVAPIQRRLPRMDLRNHRKLAIIDDRVAYMGSHNLVSADYGGRRGGPWVDLSGRFTGPVIASLATVFAEDWAFETDEELPPPSLGALSSGGSSQPGNVAMQVVPTGPTAPGESYRRILIGAVQSARRRLILTSPYFVPDEPTLVALMMAADRGVAVTLLVPAHDDHMLTAACGRAHFSRLLDAGVSIYRFRSGLVHAKTVTVDDAFSLFGSANLDVRSFNLNFELTMILYGPEATGRLRAIQLDYQSRSDLLDADRWKHRPIVGQYVDRAITLLSPLL